MSTLDKVYKYIRFAHDSALLSISAWLPFICKIPCVSRTRREAVLRILDAQGIADKICEAERIIHLSLFVNFYFINLGLSVQTHKIGLILILCINEINEPIIDLEIEAFQMCIFSKHRPIVSE